MDASVNRIPSSADERALLVAIRLHGHDEETVLQSLEELVMLVDTAGAIIVEKLVLRRQSLDAAHLIGKGQIERISALIAEKRIRLVVFDMNAVKPAQIRNLETIFKCRVVGRTEVILDIFARRARSAESKIQVELAQLRYILPRLKGLGGVLSRLGGGIGTRGPGEKMLETDRRTSCAASQAQRPPGGDRRAPQAYPRGPLPARCAGPWWAIPTRENRPFSTCWPATTSSSKTVCSPPWTPIRAWYISKRTKRPPYRHGGIHQQPGGESRRVVQVDARGNP